MKEILIVSDLAGVGKVALSAMIPLLSTPTINLSYLPTAVVSNNFAYGDAIVEPLTDFMAQSIQMWKKHHFSFDIITTGFLVNEEQAQLVKRLIQQLSAPPMVIVDPIMGEDGAIYLGMSNDLVKGMQSIIEVADLILPNMTEAALITNEPYPKEHLHRKTLRSWIDLLRERGAKSVAITSILLDEGHFVAGYAHNEQQYFAIPYHHIPRPFGGTGDIFSALITRQVAKQIPLTEAVTNATEVISMMIRAEADQQEDRALDLPIEKYLNMIRF